MNRWLPLVLLFGLAAAFRVFGLLVPEAVPNFQPLAALFFCGALLIPGWAGFAAPAAVWSLTYLLPMTLQGHSPFDGTPVFMITLLSFAAVFLLGKRLSQNGAPTLLLGSLAGALLFHLLTNGVIWLGSPFYAKSAAGLWQSLWTGPPGAAIPSWVFLRNLAAANLLFTSLVLLARFRLPAAVRADRPSLAR